MLAAALATLVVLLSVRPACRDPVVWTPDALYYQARLLEFRGASSDEALERTFGARCRRSSAHGIRITPVNAEWVAYNQPFYERRSPCRRAGAVLYPHTGDRSLLYVSLAGTSRRSSRCSGCSCSGSGIAAAAAVAVATIVAAAAPRRTRPTRSRTAGG